MQTLTRIAVAATAALLLVSAARGADYVELALTNTTTTTPRISNPPTLLQGAAYQITVRFMADADNQVDISGRTPVLAWKSTDALNAGVYFAVTGTLHNATNGQARFVIAKDALKVPGDVLFQARAENTTNTVAVIWESSVIEAVTKTGDTAVSP